MRFGEEAAALVAVGAVTPASVRLWVRTDRPGPHAIELEGPAGVKTVSVTIDDAAADHTAAFTIDLDAPGPYRFRVHRADGSLLGDGRFRTARPRGEAGRIVFAATSCHQPFADDGTLTAESQRMLKAAGRLIDETGVDFLLLMGDQMYADYPPPLSLFEDGYFPKVAPPGRKRLLDCTREEVRAIYQQRHRMFWAVKDFAALQTLCPTWTMLDDHEIKDNIGSDPEHTKLEWEPLRQGALDAFHDYQASRALPRTAEGARPRTFHQTITWGKIGVFLLDVRSARHVVGDRIHILDHAQVAELRRFLDDQRDQQVLFVMASVPLVHIRSWAADAVAKLMGEGSDAADRWSYRGAIHERDMLFRILHEHAQRHPAQKLILLGGDIHAGSALAIRFGEQGPVIHQFTASALSNRENAVKILAFELAARSTKRLDVKGLPTAEVALLPATEAAVATNPLGRLNLGLVEIDEDGTVTLKMMTSSDGDPPEPILAYQSVPIR